MVTNEQFQTWKRIEMQFLGELYPLLETHEDDDISSIVDKIFAARTLVEERIQKLGGR